MTRASFRTLAVVVVLGLVASAVGLPAAALPLPVGTDLEGASPTGASPAEMPPSESASAGNAPDLTYVEDDITENTTWSPKDGPYRIAADVTVEEGATLRIEPGTAVQPAADIEIAVRGNLSAVGTASDPVTFAPAPQAPADVRWASIRYEGTSDSRLSLTHATVERARNALTVASSAGRVEVTATEMRRIARNGIRVVNDTGTPDMTVERSTFANIGERGVAVTPATGAVGGTKVTANSSDPTDRTEHQLRLTTGADVTIDTVRVSYRGHGEMVDVARDELRAFGLDIDGNGNISDNESLLSSVTAVEKVEPNGYRIRLSRPVTVPGNVTLKMAYNFTANPRTYGTYPVEVAFLTNGVEQMARTVVPFDLRTFEGQRDRDPATSHAAGFAVTDSTFESVGEQGVFVAGDKAHGFRVTDNSFSGTGGSAVSVRGRRVWSANVDGNRITSVGGRADGVRIAGREVRNLRLRRNDISGADAGVGFVVRNGNVDRVRVDSNVVNESVTGVRVRYEGDIYSSHVSLTLADNEVSDNRHRGVAVRTDATQLRDVGVRRNEITDNGDDGILLEGGIVTGIDVRNNTVESNGNDGVRLEAARVRRTTVADNRLAENRGDGFGVRTRTLVHDVSVTSNRVLDNAGVGLGVNNSLTNAGVVNVTENLIAGNAYGVRVTGAFGSRIRNNTVVYNTYGDGAPVGIREHRTTSGEGPEMSKTMKKRYRPGTGIVVEEGEHGAIFRTGDVDEDLAELIDDREVERILNERSPDEYTVVLRPGEPGDVWQRDAAGLTVTSLSEEIPTGVVLRKDDDGQRGVVVRDNDVYGHQRGMTVNVETLVDANTTARLLVNATRTVVAERNYWGAPDGPTHASIHPEGTGDRIVTRRGWVDFVPSASSPFGPRRHRPVANLTVSPNPATVGERVTVSGAGSSDADGRVASYRFDLPAGGPNAGRNVTVSTDPDVTTSFPTNGSYTVSMAVENELGVESADAASATVAVRQPTTTTTRQPTTTATGTGQQTATTSAGSRSDPAKGDSGDGDGDAGPLAALTSLGGLLGGLLYGAGLLLGGYGAVQTFRKAGVPVGGKTINGLAAAGVGVWALFGLLGTDGLLAVAVGGGVLWLALVVLLWAATRYIYG